jgi:predicted SnoaL-like aldol condensation-catalyzing enzyme
MTNKEISLDFLMLTARGASFEAFEKYAHPDFIHHNAYFKGDATTLKEAMAAAAIEAPDKILTLKQVISDDEKVMVLSHIQFKPGDLGYAVVHILRFEDGKIIELWDLGQAIPGDMPNENGVF